MRWYGDVRKFASDGIALVGRINGETWPSRLAVVTADAVVLAARGRH